MGISEDEQVGNTKKATPTVGGIPGATQDVADETMQCTSIGAEGRSEGMEEVIDNSNVVNDLSICSTRETQEQHAPRQDDIPIPSHVGISDEEGVQQWIVSHKVPDSGTSSSTMHEAAIGLQTGNAGSASSEDKLV